MISLIKLLKENLDYNDKILDEIALKVRNKYPQINKGLCFNFSYILSEIFGFDKFTFVYDKGEIYFGEPIHVAIKLGENKYYDGYGIQDKNQFIYEWANDGHPDLITGDIEDLKEYKKILPEEDKEIKNIIKNVVISKIKL